MIQNNYFRWHKVEEELPEDGVSILMFAGWHEHFIGFYYKEHNCWVDNDENTHEPITHWRYLDKPEDLC